MIDVNMPCVVSIIIKALNEEKRIEAAVESALNAVKEVGGEVILADSCSSDRTVELASRYPITIVTLSNPAERCCGAGPQMGFQHARGEFVYILDGDMKLLPGFLPAAVAFMCQQKDVVGVGGRVVELNQQSLEYIARMERMANSSHMNAGEVDRLDMGGLYRSDAVNKSGFFSDKNLHSYEEFDLAVRLRAQGGRLWRLPIDVVQHHGHDTPPYQLLKRRWQSKYICGLGELIRAAWGEPHFALVLSGVRELKLYIAVLAWWGLLLALLVLPLSFVLKCVLLLGLLLLPFVAMWWRKRSVAQAVFSVLSWCVNAAGLVRGVLLPRRDPHMPLATVVLQAGVPPFMGPESECP